MSEIPCDNMTTHHEGSSLMHYYREKPLHRRKLQRLDMKKTEVDPSFTLTEPGNFGHNGVKIQRCAAPKLTSNAKRLPCSVELEQVA